MVLTMLRWMGVPEAEVRMVEGMYEKTTTRVVMGEGASEEFEVSIGLRQGSVLSAAVHTSSGPNQQEDRAKGCHEGTHLWQTTRHAGRESLLA